MILLFGVLGAFTRNYGTAAVARSLPAGRTVNELSGVGTWDVVGEWYCSHGGAIGLLFWRTSRKGKKKMARERWKRGVELMYCIQEIEPEFGGSGNRVKEELPLSGCTYTVRRANE